MSKAFILNTGIITAIGAGFNENLQAMKNGVSGISMPEILETVHHLPVGEIKKNNAALAKEAGGTEHLPRTALLSLWAAKEAWQPFQGHQQKLRIAFISANTVGGMDFTERYYKAFLKDNHGGSTEDIRYHECGSITEIVMEQLNMHCWNTTLSTACSSSANSIMMAAKLIEQNRYDLILAGGADSLSRFTLNGFHSLMILDQEWCRPFDRDRRGLNLGEGAAYLVLGNEKAANRFGITPQAILSGYANANDAHHQTASSPEGNGNRMAMQQALKQAGLASSQIDYINLHGTGTENNDASEGMAVQDVFETKIPLASSTKAYTGHTLGAAGAVEAVFSVMAIREQTAWPNLHLKNNMEQLSWKPNTAVTQYPIRHVLSNSFGFGGNCSTLVISEI